jgi:hypothetical protein
MSKNTKFVSIVMPVHNGGAYLRQAVNSILSQTHTEIELLLIDDHSDDGAISALDLSDSRLKLLSSKVRGVVSAFNAGFDQARGDYIARMDADDISDPERITHQLRYLEGNPEIDIVGCCVSIFAAEGIAGGMKRYEDWLNSVRKPSEVHNQIYIESPLPNPTLLFKRAALEKLGGYRDEPWPEDYDLLLRADAMGMRMGKPDAILFRWREHETRVTHVDPRYSRHAFMQAKVHFLVQHRLKGQPIIIWGAGTTGRDIHDLLSEQGAQIEGFIEVHPRRIGGQKRGLPVWGIEYVGQQTTEIILVAVGSAAARHEIAAYLIGQGKTEGEDYLFVA